MFRVIYSASNLEVQVEETDGSHNHAEDPETRTDSKVYHWSRLETQIIREGVANNLKPSVIRRNLRNRGALSDPEPSTVQLNNKISHVKKKENMNEPINTTQDLRNKLRDFQNIPVSENESWVPLCQINDTEIDEEVRITVIFGTNKKLEHLNLSDTFHCLFGQYKTLLFQHFPSNFS